jgi:hypothetical protein
MLTKRLQRYRPVTCGRHENTSLGHVDVRLSAPMSSSALGPHTAPSAQKVVQPVAPRGRASARSSRGPLTARRPIRVRRPAVRRGAACCPEPAMRSRRWRSGSVGPPDPGRGCPEPVKPILLTDIGVCMSQRAQPLGSLQRLAPKAAISIHVYKRQRSAGPKVQRCDGAVVGPARSAARGPAHGAAHVADP